jgi:hypothetical protein
MIGRRSASQGWSRSLIQWHSKATGSGMAALLLLETALRMDHHGGEPSASVAPTGPLSSGLTLLKVEASRVYTRCSNRRAKRDVLPTSLHSQRPTECLGSDTQAMRPVKNDVPDQVVVKIPGCHTAESSNPCLQSLTELHRSARMYQQLNRTGRTCARMCVVVGATQMPGKRRRRTEWARRCTHDCAFCHVACKRLSQVDPRETVPAFRGDRMARAITRRENHDGLELRFTECRTAMSCWIPQFAATFLGISETSRVKLDPGVQLFGRPVLQGSESSVTPAESRRRIDAKQPCRLPHAVTRC